MSSALSVIDTERQSQISGILRMLEIGMSRGDTLIDIGIAVDKFLGFRDASGKLLTGAIDKGGMTYKSMRVIRTELARSFAQGAQQEFEVAKSKGIKTRLMLVATLDDRTRPQSAKMDGKMSNDEGKFQYPDGNWYFPHQTGHPEWDINDRETTIQIIEGYTADARTQGEGQVPYQDFEEWAQNQNIDENQYGQQYWL